MPIIAIAPSSKLPDYVESIRRAGGEPRVPDRAADAPADVLQGVDAILLTGGNDVRPALYHENPHHTFEAAEEGRDEYEMELVHRALEADLPILAICRGLQLFNVALGGTLIQHIPDEVGSTVNHVLREPPSAVAHDVRITADSLLESLVGPRIVDARCAVNSRHHQAPKSLGDGLIVTAIAPDGVIEAVEDPARRFCLGVQWHPENFWRTGEFDSIFHAFVKAAAR